MFLINKQVDYSVQFLLELAILSPGKFLSLRIFSQNRNISFLFLQKIARTLKAAGFIDAQKGVLGGYHLKCDPEKITLKDIVEAIEGKYIAVSCMKNEHNCPITKICLSKNALFHVQEDILSTLESYTLAKMAHIK